MPAFWNHARLLHVENLAFQLRLACVCEREFVFVCAFVCACVCEYVSAIYCINTKIDMQLESTVRVCIHTHTYVCVCTHTRT